MHTVTTPGQTKAITLSPRFRRLRQFRSETYHHHSRRSRFLDEHQAADQDARNRNIFGFRNKCFEPIFRTCEDRILD